MSSSNKSFSLALFFCLNLILFSSLAIAQPIVPASSPTPNCSRNVRVCASVLNIVNLTIGQNLGPCCQLIQGLAAAEVDICIQTAISNALRASLSGLPPVNLSVESFVLRILLSRCNRAT
ncbi:putative lipid-binding protein AIR1B [Cucumis sativus]|uniref:putative lipid-binding protein AIR1B n=1 Tax=Cucumis sativus TaxID=3659 RepID=UPI0012F4A0D5|nr:putative lipid-binding protein AIR1B [Cucumis sativus]KGN55893.2 hypothetical protein Csa_010099 [Cucumis sativus]